MSGTLATYQGLPVRDVRFRRTRGTRADTTMVVFAAEDFPEGFSFATPDPGQLVRATTVARLDLRQLRGPPAPARPLPRPRRLEFSGSLVMAEVDRSGREYVVVIDPLYCVSVETIRRSSDGTVALVVARLVDERYFYAQGFIRRWSFNRTDGSGSYSKDSVKPGGEPFSLAEVGNDVAQHLFGNPVLAKTPDKWKEWRPVLELPRFAPAAAALTKLAQEHGAGELCLDMDGSVALYPPGEGRVGYAPGGKGAGNPGDFPEGLHLDLKGAGQSRGIEATYPPDYVLVVGGLRVATVRMDDLDPVLDVDGTIVPLTEQTVRKLTGDRFGLEWLCQFVLAPQAYQNEIGLAPRVVALLREQAFRLWRIPGVEIEEPFQEAPAPARSPLVSGLNDGEPADDPVIARLRRETAGQPNRAKGPNAHLLPLRDRAETSAGRRLPVRVDTYRFASAHRAMGGSEEASAVAQALRELRRLREEIKRAAKRLGKRDPFDGSSLYFGFDTRYMTAPELQGLLKTLGLRHVSSEQFHRAINHLRAIDRIREVDEGHAAEYERSIRQLYEIEGAAGGPGPALFDLANEVVTFERKAAETRSWDEPLDEEAREQAGLLRRRIQDELRALDRQVEANRQRTRVGATPQATPNTAVFVRNLPRQLDPDARVYSAELGVIQTSDLSGHVAEEGVPTAETTSFVPKSPLVTFGAVVRPRIDASRGRVATGGTRTGKLETRIPEALGDEESYYTAAFRRLGQGRAEQVELGAIPPGQGVPVERPDLVELVPLEGGSNKASLDKTAMTIAEGLFDRPDKVEQAKYSIARPWPVNCDGVVAGVEIAMRPSGKGFVTTIHTGSEAPKLAPLGQTRVRVRRGQPSDNAAREGILP